MGFADEICGCRWVSTVLGVHSMCHNRRLRNPRPLFEVRSVLPLKDQSVFELMTQLRDAWTWQEWLPPSRRPRTCMIPIGYSQEASEMWYSGGTVAHHYLLCFLLRAICSSKDSITYHMGQQTSSTVSCSTFCSSVARPRPSLTSQLMTMTICHQT